MNTDGISVKDLSFSYGKDREVLRTVSFEASPGDLVSILGKNGAGKSTLFKCLLGILRNYEGEIRIGGGDVRHLSAGKLSRKAAYIPQSHYPAFNYTVLDMVLMGAASRLGSLGTPGKKQEEEALRALERMNILHLRDRGFSGLSGGEQQLVLMARAMMQNAGIWILDEPLSSLDYGNQIRLLKRLRELSGEGYLIIQSIHDPDMAYQYSRRILALSGGRLLADGKPSEVMNEELIQRLYGEDIIWKRKGGDGI